MARQYGKWMIKETLGEGGQGFTYLVHEAVAPEKGEFVLKRLKNPKRLPRFAAEIDAYLKLKHPNVVELVDFDLNGDPAYLVVEHCPSGPLSKADLSGWSLDEKLQLFASICSGVAAAHEAGIVHRDLKPDNIFLRADGRSPVVGDFGICYFDENGDRLTVTEEAVGPRLYMAPELEDGRLKDVAASADIYSLGKVLYWILTNRTFSREKHRETEFSLATIITQPAAAHLAALLDRMITSELGNRFKNATELSAALASTRELIAQRAHLLNLKEPQHCIYCARGTYQPMAGSGQKFGRNPQFIGLQNYSDLNLMILICNHCGNVQQFALHALSKGVPWTGL